MVPLQYGLGVFFLPDVLKRGVLYREPFGYDSEAQSVYLSLGDKD